MFACGRHLGSINNHHFREKMTVFNQDCFLLQRQLKARAKKAIEQLQLRTLKQGDKVWLIL